jgi:hypothetical protein
MRTIDDLEVSFSEFERPEVETSKSLFDRLESKKLIIIIAAIVMAFCVRVYRLDASGLAEDETNKIFSVRVYEQGDFTVNADHPMLMKMLCFASIHASGAWNRMAGDSLGLGISEETALRLPNVTFGALTVVPLFLFTAALFGFRIGLITSLLWALGLNAVWINRVVKEDTLLVFFMFMGFYLFHLAKSRPASDIKGQERLYALTGAAFGLMMASKYFPHYFGLIVLFYHLAGYDSRDNRPRTRRMTLLFLGAILLTFVAFNPAMFVPKTWRYLSEFASGNLITHHGYLVMDSLFNNEMGAMPHGTPWYFYFLFLAVKLPLPLLAAFLVGMLEVFRHRLGPDKSRGYLFLRIMLVFWLFPMAIVGSKFLRYTLSLMPLIYITAAVGMVVIWRAASSLIKKLSVDARFAERATAAAIAVVFVVVPSLTTVLSLPYPSLYLNALGSGKVGYFFPHDEFYDLGARESIRYVAEHAPRGATLASEIPGVVEYYLERYNRSDIRSKIISHPKFDLVKDPPDYVLLQRGRTYFENLEDFKLLESACSPVQASTYMGADAARVYKIDLAALQAVNPTINPSVNPR